MSPFPTPADRDPHIIAGHAGGDLFFVTPTAGEARVVEAAVRKYRTWVRPWMCGIGAGRAAAACSEFERQARPGGVVLLGWAGGLVEHLAVGDIVIADQAFSASGDSLDCARLSLPGVPRVHYGPKLTAGQLLATPEAKRWAAKTGALAVEMEAYPLAAWAAEHKVPFVHARVILDTVHEALPETNRMLDGYGRLQLAPLLGAIAARPALSGEFARFMLRLHRVNQRLAGLAEAVLASALPRNLDRTPLVS